MPSKVPLKKALLIIFGSTLLISGSFSLCLLYFRYIHWKLSADPKYEIVAIVQETAGKEPLKTVYLAELLNLSLDKRTNIYRFNLGVAKKRLLASPLIKKAEVKKIYPGTIYVRYEARVPVAFLADFENVALDREGVLFPFKPFFTPKNLTEIYLGLKEKKELSFGSRIKSKKLKLALQLLETFSDKLAANNTSIKRIDVKDAFASSVGQKQIVVLLEKKQEKIRNGYPVFTRILRMLRLSSSEYREGLTNYLVLQDYLHKKEGGGASLDTLKVIDLRIPQLGLLKN